MEKLIISSLNLLLILQEKRGNKDRTKKQIHNNNKEGCFTRLKYNVLSITEGRREIKGIRRENTKTIWLTAKNTAL